ncbi:MAG: transcriptional regulator, LysR family [Polyangiaceae bacterium]|jgi:DNA-binding transcriptional LysR family regulator|nr:transcriptional regulator, LysR family [Polyangiaceae bacterium]
MDVSWEDVRLFLAIADHGSLTEAARRLRVGQPTVSRRLAELEENVGYPLFQRSVEGATLTSQGERWLEPARRMAEWAGELSRAGEHADAAPTGVVRVAAPPGVAYDFVAPFARLVRERYPHIELQVLARVEYADLGRREADIALRVRAPTQRDLTVVYELPHFTDVFVSKAYAKKLPPCPALADLSFIVWAPPFDELPPNPQLRAAVPDFRAGFAADDYIVQIRAAEAGVGAMFMPKIKHRFNQSSPLVPLGLDLGQHSQGEMRVVCAKSALGVARIRAVAELLREELEYAEKLSAEAFGPVR